MDRRYHQPSRRKSAAQPASRVRVVRRTPEPRSAARESAWRSYVRGRSLMGIGGLIVVAMVIGGVVFTSGESQDDFLSAPQLSTASLEYGSAELTPMPTEASRYQTIRQELKNLPLPKVKAGDLLLLSSCPSTGPQATGPNGRMPESSLCSYRNIKVRADAAEAVAKMDQAFQQAFGKQMCLGNGYRPYSQQAQMHKSRPHMVAPPGRSNHGLGLAIDFCGANQKTGSAEYSWMMKNASSFGWVLPGWARPGGSKPEPWHWEFQGVGRNG